MPVPVVFCCTRNE